MLLLILLLHGSPILRREPPTDGTKTDHDYQASPPNEQGAGIAVDTTIFNISYSSLFTLIQTLRAFRRTIPVVLCISVVVAMYVLFGMLNVLTLL